MGHIALRACVVRFVLLSDQNDEVQVVPDVVLQFDVLLERHRLVVKLVSLQTCGEPTTRQVQEPVSDPGHRGEPCTHSR